MFLKVPYLSASIFLRFTKKGHASHWEHFFLREKKSKQSRTHEPLSGWGLDPLKAFCSNASPRIVVIQDFLLALSLAFNRFHSCQRPRM
jgi:hypothetical protein